MIERSSEGWEIHESHNAVTGLDGGTGLMIARSLPADDEERPPDLLTWVKMFTTYTRI